MPRPVPATIVTAPVDATNEDPATGCCFYFGGTRLKRNAVAPAPLPTSIVKTSPTTDPTSPPRRRRPSTAQPKPTSTSSPPPIHHGTLGSNPELATSAAKSISDLRQMIGKSIGELTRTFSAHFKHHANPVMKALSIDDELRVFVGTWNMFGRPPPEDLAPFIERPRSYADDPTIPYHFLVVGTQECEKSIEKSVLLPSKDRWEKFLQAYLDERYAFVCSETMAAIHVAVFVLKELKDFVKDPQTGAVATGIANVIGNKGGVGVGLNIGNKISLLFVNAHFTAHQNKIAERNADFHRISSELPLQGFRPGAKPLLDRFDYVFWLGDLNYRINSSRKMVDSLLEKDMFEVLLANDQLNIERKRRSVFAGFEEAPITFPPTYKFDVVKLKSKGGEPQTELEEPTSPASPGINERLPGSVEDALDDQDVTLTDKSVEASRDSSSAVARSLASPAAYDSSKKQRVQSWTDRILYRRFIAPVPIARPFSSIARRAVPQLNMPPLPAVECRAYGSRMEMTWSDHKPVYGVYAIPFNWDFIREQVRQTEEQHQSASTGFCSIM